MSSNYDRIQFYSSHCKLFRTYNKLFFTAYKAKFGTSCSCIVNSRYLEKLRLMTSNKFETFTIKFRGGSIKEAIKQLSCLLSAFNSLCNALTNIDKRW